MVEKGRLGLKILASLNYFMSIRLVPKFIKARTERDAMLQVLRYQLANKKQCNIINVYENKDGGITVWFMDEISNKEITQDGSSESGSR